MAKDHEKSAYFSTNAKTHRHNCEYQKFENGLVSKDAIELESCKQIYLMPDEDKTISGSLVLDLRI